MEGQSTVKGQSTVVSARREAAQQMLQNILNSWSVNKTARAAHSSMLSDDQQKIVKWTVEHKQVTITKYAQVCTSPPALRLCLCLCHVAVPRYGIHAAFKHCILSLSLLGMMHDQCHAELLFATLLNKILASLMMQND